MFDQYEYVGDSTDKKRSIMQAFKDNVKSNKQNRSLIPSIEDHKMDGEIYGLGRMINILRHQMESHIEEYSGSSKISDILSDDALDRYISMVEGIFKRHGYDFKPTKNTTYNQILRKHDQLINALKDRNTYEKITKRSNAKKILRAYKKSKVVGPKVAGVGPKEAGFETPIKKAGVVEIQLSELEKQSPSIQKAKVLSVSGKPLPEEEEEEPAATGGGGVTGKKTWVDFAPVTTILKGVKKATDAIGSQNATAINEEFANLGIVRNYHEKTTKNTIETAISKITGILKGKPKEVVDFEQHIYKEEEFTPVRSYLNKLGADKDTILTPDQIEEVNEYLTSIDFPTIKPTDPETGLKTTPSIVRQKNKPKTR
jgi:hypothetical protein